MIVVLDTCALLWITLDPERLSEDARKLYAEAELRLVCSISIWEIGIKWKNGRLNLGTSFDDYFELLNNCHEFSISPIDASLWARSLRLPWDHRDPSDRLIVALAQTHQAYILTSDARMKRYYERCIS